ncbi:MAG: FlgD immunoglobulin-like domain containing protein [bacterium]
MMKNTHRKRFAAAVVGIAAAIGITAVSPASAQTGGTYDLSWNTIDGGGATFSTGGTYSLGGTIGQYDVGTLIGGSYVLSAGFWKGGVTPAATGIDIPAEPPAAPSGLPVAYRLYPNVPNPFNPRTTIAYDLPAASDVRLSIYDVSGALVRELERGARPAGRFTTMWEGKDSDGREVASGVYFLRLEAGSFGESRKLVLAK